MAGGPLEPKRSDFRLTPNEDFLFGVSVDDGVLRFGPPGSALLVAAVSCVGSALLGMILWFVPYDEPTGGRHGLDPGVGRVVGAVLVVLGAWHLAVRVRSGVRASIDGVTIRGLWHSETYPWERVDGTRIVINDPPPPFGLRIGGGAPGGGFAVDVESCKAYLVLDNSSEVLLRGFESAGRRSSGLPRSIPTPTELKVQALRRFRAELVGPWRWGDPNR